MKLLEELRKVDPGNPGHWSMRVSVVLACILFVLATALGLQVRVRGQTLPELANAGAALPRLQQQRETARLAEDRVRRLRSEVGRLQKELEQSWVWIPESGESLDLAVSLAAASGGSPVREVRPWRPATVTSRPLPYAGGEIEVIADYREIVHFLDLALAQGPLRELIQLEVEPGAETDAGGLRAAVRLLAYFGNGETAEILGHKAGSDPPQAPARLPQAELPSPFGSAAGHAASAATAKPVEAAAPRRQAGHIRVGGRRYELIEDPAGNIRLEEAER